MVGRLLPLHWHLLVSSFNSATWRELYKRPKRSVVVTDRQKIFAYWPQKKSKIKCGFGSWLTAHDATATAAYWFLHCLPPVPLLLSLPPASPLCSSPLFFLFSFCFAKTLPYRLANLNWTRFKRRYQSRRVSPPPPYTPPCAATATASITIEMPSIIRFNETRPGASSSTRVKVAADAMPN